MVMLQPLAIALRTDRGRRNIMVHSRNIPSEDVGRCTAQLMTQLARCVPSSAAGPDLILGIQSACLSQGVFEATGRRYIVTWRMLNEVMIISIVPSGTSILTAHRASRAVAQLLLIYCKSTTAVTMDRLFKKYVQVHAAMGALLRDNGQDHQRAFLDGEGIIGLLKPGAQQPKAKTLLGLTNKDKQHAATRAGDRALQEVLDEAAHASALAPAPAQRVKAATGVSLPHQLSGAAVKASAARNSRVRSTIDGFTRPELARAADAAARAGEVLDAGGALAGLDDVVALPGFQIPHEQWPNRLADPEGKLRPPAERSDGEEEEEEEEEEESEVSEQEDEEVESEGPQPLPGLGDVSDVMLVEQWHALFVGPRMEAAATSGHVVCTRSELACFVKIGVPSGRSDLLKAVERSRGHAASFAPEDAEAIRKREIAEAGGTSALETESEYSADLPDTQPALRLAVRAKGAKNGASSPTKVDVGADQPVRSVIEYQLTAAQLPPPFLACMQVHEIPLGEASSMGLPKWDVMIRVRIQASTSLPSPTIHGTLSLTLPESAPTLASCSVKASYVKRKNVVTVSVPPLTSEKEFDFRVKLSGSSSVSGPGGEHITGLVRLFSEPMAGSLTGTSILSGNSLSELEVSKGHYLCNLRLKPIVQRFKLPESVAAAVEEAQKNAEVDGQEQDASGTEAETAAAPGTTASGAPIAAGVVDTSAGAAASPVSEGYAPAMPVADMIAGGGAPQAAGGSGAVDSMAPLI